MAAGVGCAGRRGGHVGRRCVSGSGPGRGTQGGHGHRVGPWLPGPPAVLAPPRRFASGGAVPPGRPERPGAVPAHRGSRSPG